MPNTDQTSSSDQSQEHFSCSHCGYDLSGLDLHGECPECGRSIISTCFMCDYDLSGLGHAGVCPECGFTIEGSIGHGELANADPTYLGSLHKGVYLIQISIILTFLLGLVAGFIGFITGISQPAGGSAGPADSLVFRLVSAIIGVAISVVAIYGWWLFTAEDPDYKGQDTGTKARKLIRVMIVLSAVFTVINIGYRLLPTKDLILGITIAFGVISIVINAIRFFAAMYYIRWMAPLMRNKKVYKRAKLLLWLGPVLMTFGLLLIGLGPLIALVLYYNMLGWLRKDLKAIRQLNGSIT